MRLAKLSPAICALNKMAIREATSVIANEYENQTINKAHAEDRTFARVEYAQKIESTRIELVDK